MGDKEVPFDPKAVCDWCGELGAFDFMGDLICSQCLAEDSEADDEDFGYDEEEDEQIRLD